jgi:hypothetical protein
MHVKNKPPMQRNTGGVQFHQFYTDKSRESDPHALPDAEVWYARCKWTDPAEPEPEESGWYYWLCSDGNPIGPFPTEEEAVEYARGSEGAFERAVKRQWAAMDARVAETDDKGG